MAVEFKTKKKSRKPITVTVDGEDFQFKPPKMAAAILPAFEGDTSEAKATLDWFKQGLSDEDYQRLIGRMKDDEDDFDFEDLGELVQDIIAEIGGNPTS